MSTETLWARDIGEFSVFIRPVVIYHDSLEQNGPSFQTSLSDAYIGDELVNTEAIAQSCGRLEEMWELIPGGVTSASR